MALTIATGFVVDDAIVMIENIARYIEEGETLIAVLIPLLFMGDVVGRLFREFAISLAITILISAVVSLTLVPMMSARWLKPHDEEKQTRFGRRFQQFFDWVVGHYDTALVWVLDRRGLTLLVALATVLLTALLYVVIP